MDTAEHRVDDFFDDDGENWLHAAWIVCPACGQWLLRIDESPLDNSSHLYCDRCPVRIDVHPYGPIYEQIEQIAHSLLSDHEGDAQYRAALRRAIEARLKPCRCGGTFRFDAPRRCFSCYTPVINEGPAGVDLYLNQDAFAEHLDAERKLRYEAWRAQFLPDLDDNDRWKSPADPEL